MRGQSFTEKPGAFGDGPDASQLIFGATIADVNRDGRPDLYHPGRLYLQFDGPHFDDILESSRFETMDGSVPFGGVFGDADGDGFPDLYVEDFDPGSRFFRNRFGIRWDLANAASGIDMSQAQSQGAVWGDYDQDGDLDLFVGEEFGSNKLFENIGDGRYRDAGLSGILNERKSYGVAGADFDLDGDLDIYIAACSTTDPSKSINSLFRNEGDGTFTDVGAEAQVADSLAGWAVVWTDMDRDGWPDIFVANMPIYGPDARDGINKLYRNLGDGRFEDVAAAAGVAGGVDDWGFGASAADFDNDGWEDLYLANDFSPHRLYRNKGDGTYEDVMPGLGLLPFEGAIAVAVADVDQDGWVDVVTAARKGNRLFVNDGGMANFLKVRLRAAGENVDGVGARVMLWVGDRPMMRFIAAGDGMTSQNHDYTAHFGLDQAERVDSVRVFWPDGNETALRDVEANQTVYLTQSKGVNGPTIAPVLEGDQNRELGRASATFSWQAAADPDGDSVVYTFALLSLEERGPQAEIIVEGITATDVTVDLAPFPAGEYVWTVVSDDGLWKRAPTITHTVTITDATAVEHELDPAFQVFPNPFRSVLSVVTSKPSTLVLFDVTGRQVAQFQAESGTARLPVETLPAGVYYLRAPETGTAGVPVLKLR